MNEPPPPEPPNPADDLHTKVNELSERVAQLAEELGKLQEANRRTQERCDRWTKLCCPVVFTVIFYVFAAIGYLAVLAHPDLPTSAAVFLAFVITIVAVMAAVSWTSFGRNSDE